MVKMGCRLQIVIRFQVWQFYFLKAKYLAKRMSCHFKENIFNILFIKYMFADFTVFSKYLAIYINICSTLKPFCLTMLEYLKILAYKYIVSIVGQEEGYTVKYIPPPEGVPEGEARGNS